MAALMAKAGISTQNIPSDEDLVKLRAKTYNETIGDLNEYDKYNCDKCKNKGYTMEVRHDNIWYEVQVECECMKVRRTIRKFIKSGLSNVVKDCTFNKFEVSEEWQGILKNAAMDYVVNHGDAWFFIGGQSGAGKSFLCTAIAGQFLKQGKDVKYMLWRDDVTRLKSSVTDAQMYNDLINEYKNAEILYIDDLFKNGKDKNNNVMPPTAADVQIAFEILNYRVINKNKITIISSERRIEELADIDEATAGRIAQKSFKYNYGFNVANDRRKNYRLKNLTTL